MTLSMPRTIVLDAEAVSALARGQHGVAELLEAALRTRSRAVIPSVVLAEVMTGAPADAAIWRVANRIPVIPIDSALAATAGRLREQAESVRREKRDLTVDAIVAAVAASVAPATVATSDIDDLTLLLAGSDVTTIHVHTPGAPTR